MEQQDLISLVSPAEAAPAQRPKEMSSVEAAAATPQVAASPLKEKPATPLTEEAFPVPPIPPPKAHTATAKNEAPATTTVASSPFLSPLQLPASPAAAQPPAVQSPTLSTPLSSASRSSSVSSSSVLQSPTLSISSVPLRSKSPLPPRPITTTNVSYEEEEGDDGGAAYLSPAAKESVAFHGSPKHAGGGLQEIKEEETECEEEVEVEGEGGIDVEAVTEAIARRLMLRGASRSVDFSSSSSSAPAPAAAAAAAATTATTRAAGNHSGAASPVYARLHGARLQKDFVDPGRAFMTGERTFHPKRATEGTEERFEGALPRDQEYRQQHSIFDRLYAEHEGRKDYYRQAEEIRLQKEVVGCSFAPRLVLTDDYNREHVQPAAGEQDHTAASVFDRLYNGLYAREDKHRYYSDVKTHLELQDCTFVPAILESAAGDEESRAAHGPVWERLHQERTERAARKERRLAVAAQQEKAKAPFKPSVRGPAALGIKEEQEQEQEKVKPHERLYMQGEQLRKRAEQRSKQKPHGCTFQPQLVAHDTLEGQRKAKGVERAEELYRKGRERVMKDLQKDMARRPPKPRSDAEECTFFPQTNHLRKKT